MDGPFFIVGVPRSGTTLLRQMLRGHPRLAIPRESHFVPHALAATSGEAALDVILTSRHFAEWGVDAGDVRRRAQAHGLTPVAAVRAAFEAYAAAQGRPRWGDKTPGYVRHIPRIAAAFPDAAFVHIIRDGREVAASLRDAWWGADDVLLAAYQWRRNIREARSAATALPPSRYLEVRYADLVVNPEAELARILGWLGEEMVDGLLDYTDRVVSEQPELPVEHRYLLEPPRVDTRDWRVGCSPAEQVRVEALLASTLRLLALAPGDPSSRWRRAEAEALLLARRARRKRHRVQP